ncbi:SEC-C metal-binding domain-containing protein [Aureibacillus halotolerans]|uniref:SEC-C motif-containing protein n=1 Tax=Aureibacillus halotolerans TaxID=1508390 RepID=A0A4R6TYU1_9BACI|nr:SEC-C metal-binding domain-containing protein [Aureibacillus halotolerans]TDQ37125.1 SEC-C motif-containing protein [Aureibacillus halotolerans]
MKVQRNDPCPCGSGKKYKKCCLLINKEFVSPQEVQMLYQGVRKEFYDLFNTYTQPMILEKADEYAEEEHMFTDMLLYQTHHETNQTWLEHYVERTIKRISSEGLRTLYRRWPNVVPSVLRVETWVTHARVIGTDLFTGEEKTVQLNAPVEKDQLGSDALLLANLIPFGDDGLFMAFANEWFFDREDCAPQLEALEEDVRGRKQADIEDFLKINYSEWVLDLLNPVADEDVIQWNDPNHVKVLNLYTTYREAVKSPIDGDGVVGTIFWHRYCQKEAPRIRKPERYAAGLLYFTDEGWPIEGQSVSKQEAAEAFGVSLSAVADVERQFRQFMDDELEHSPDLKVDIDINEDFVHQLFGPSHEAKPQEDTESRRIVMEVLEQQKDEFVEQLAREEQTVTKALRMKNKGRLYRLKETHLWFDLKQLIGHLLVAMERFREAERHYLELLDADQSDPLHIRLHLLRMYLLEETWQKAQSLLAEGRMDRLISEWVGIYIRWNIEDSPEIDDDDVLCLHEKNPRIAEEMLDYPQLKAKTSQDEEQLELAIVFSQCFGMLFENAPGLCDYLDNLLTERAQ